MHAEVLNGPVTQTVPVTQSEAQFTCHARASVVFWYINGGILFNSVLNWTKLYDDDHDFDNIEVTRRIGVITQGRNGTKIECLATGSDQTIDRSAPAFLYTVGKYFNKMNQFWCYNIGRARRPTWAYYLPLTR